MWKIVPSTCLVLLAATGVVSADEGSQTQRPNIIYIYADDLGYGDLGCYGQQHIRTPHLDQLAARGIRFTQHYSGSPVCAPSRCMLLTGLHSGHAYIRANDEMKEMGDVWNDPSLEGQRPLPKGTRTLGSRLQELGYRTAAVGKWGLGGPATSGHPTRQGFDLFYGYLCQRIAHNYYPTHLWRNNEKHMLDNEYFKVHTRLPPDRDPLDADSYRDYEGRDYAVDFMTREAIQFVEDHRSRPFFLYLAYTVPHVALQVPDDSLDAYRGQFPETPYLGDKGYSPHRTPRAAYAAMVTRMDQQIGQLLEKLDEWKLTDNTLIMFSSDNGPTYNGGTDTTFFNSAGGLRGLKGSLYEGGIRVPMIACWPGRIPAGRTTDHVSAQWDVTATVLDVLAADAPEGDGISFWPTLRGQDDQASHDHLYWEYLGQQALRQGDWKIVRRGLRKNPQAAFQLFNLADDPAEKTNLAKQHPDRVRDMAGMAKQAREPSAFAKWNF